MITSQTTVRRFLARLALVFIAAALAAPCVAATDHIREFAKNGPRVVMVVSGPAASVTAHLLQDAILHYGDNKHTAADLPILTLSEAESAVEKDAGFGNSPIVFLLCGKELGNPLPPQLASILPFKIAGAQKTSVVSSVLSAQKDGQFFRVGLFAPDAERLRKLYEIFINRKAENFRALPFDQTYITNKLALFSTPGERDEAEQWGKLTDSYVWNDIQWFSLADRDRMTPDQLSGRTRVYFLNRADHAAPPMEAGAALTGHSLKPVTTFIGKQEKVGDADDGGVIVFDAPNGTILWGKALHRFPNAGAVPTDPIFQDAVDLRAATKTALLMSGRIPDGERGAVRQLLTADIRKALGLDIEESDGERRVPLEQLEAVTDTTDGLRQSGLRYVLHFAATDYQGRTEYEPILTKVTPDAAAFSEIEPVQPSRSKGLFQGNKPKEQYDKEMADYNSAHAAWQAKKDDYDRKLANTNYRWARRINTHEFAHAHGVLRLIDMSDPTGGKVVWEHECDGSGESLAMYRHDVVEVRGQNNRPPGLELPPTSTDCAPALLLKAVRTATADALLDLRESTLTAQDGAPAPTDYHVSETPASAPPSDSSDGTAYVADVQDGVVTLNIGAAQGVRVGDKVIIPIKTKEITDPITGKVIDVRVLDSAVLRVTASGATADCALASAGDTAKLNAVHRGMAVKWEHGGTSGEGR